MLRVSQSTHIEYGFHVTLIVAGAIIATFFITVLRRGIGQASARAA